MAPSPSIWRIRNWPFFSADKVKNNSHMHTYVEKREGSTYEETLIPVGWFSEFMNVLLQHGSLKIFRLFLIRQSERTILPVIYNAVFQLLRQKISHDPSIHETQSDWKPVQWNKGAAGRLHPPQPPHPTDSGDTSYTFLFSRAKNTSYEHCSMLIEPMSEKTMARAPHFKEELLLRAFLQTPQLCNYLQSINFFCNHLTYVCHEIRPINNLSIISTRFKFTSQKNNF